MTSRCDLFLVALAERLNRLWGRHLNLDVRFRPCQPLERYAVEVMVGLPATTAWQELALGAVRGLAVMDMQLLTGVIDRQLGGPGVPEEEVKRGPTLVEEAVARKMFEKVLEGVHTAWQGFLPQLGTLTIVPSDGSLRSPWEPTAQVVETAFLGGWPGCDGVVRFLWPLELATEAFGAFDCERVDVDDWRPQPWQIPSSVRPPEIHFGPKWPTPTAASTVTETPALNPTKPDAKPRIAFDDFDAMIAALKG